MKHFLSILLCLAMLASAFAFAETTDTILSKRCVIDDIVVEVDGESFALPVTGDIGIACSDNAILMDFGLEYDSDALFPIQVKFAKDSFSLLIGNSETAYVFSGEMLEDDQIDYGALVEAYCNLFSVLYESSDWMRSFSDIGKNLQAVIDEEFCAASEATTYEGRAARQSTGKVDGAVVYNVIDKMFAAVAPNLDGAYYRFLNEYVRILELFSYAVEYGEDPDDAVQTEIASFADLAPLLGIEIVSCDYSIISTDSGAGEADYKFTLHIPESELEYVLDLTLVRNEEGKTSFSGGCTYPGEFETTNFTFSGSADASGFSVEIAADSENVDTAYAIGFSENADGTSTTRIEINESADEYSISCEGAAVTDANGNSNADYSFGVDVNNHSYNAQFSLSSADAEIEDRIATANVKSISTMDDLTNAGAMLQMRLMSLAGDVETLMNDTVFAALSETFSQLYIDDNLYIEDVTYTAEDMPFEIPEFTYLPEGYSLTDEYYTVYSDGTAYARLAFALGDESDSYTEGIYVYIDNYTGPQVCYLLDADGTLTELESAVIAQSDYKIEASFICDGVSYSIVFYSEDFTVDDAVSFINGIVWGGVTDNPNSESA